MPGILHVGTSGYGPLAFYFRKILAGLAAVCHLHWLLIDFSRIYRRFIFLTKLIIPFVITTTIYIPLFHILITHCYRSRRSHCFAWIHGSVFNSWTQFERPWTNAVIVTHVQLLSNFLPSCSFANKLTELCLKLASRFIGNCTPSFSESIYFWIISLFE